MRFFCFSCIPVPCVVCVRSTACVLLSLSPFMFFSVSLSPVPTWLNSRLLVIFPRLPNLLFLFVAAIARFLAPLHLCLFVCVLSSYRHPP